MAAEQDRAIDIRPRSDGALLTIATADLMLVLDDSIVDIALPIC